MLDIGGRKAIKNLNVGDFLCNFAISLQNCIKIEDYELYRA